MGAELSLSLPGLTQQSIRLCTTFCEEMGARVKSAFTRVFDALLLARDVSRQSRIAVANLRRPAARPRCRFFGGTRGRQGCRLGPKCEPVTPPKASAGRSRGSSERPATDIMVELVRSHLSEGQGP
jgi:hypothetical protein